MQRAAIEEAGAPEREHKGRHVREEPVELMSDASVLTVFRAHLALGQIPGGKYAVAFGGGLFLLIVLMGGLTLLGMLL